MTCYKKSLTLLIIQKLNHVYISRKIMKFRIAGLVVLAVFLCTYSLSHADNDHEKHVVIISIDGFPSWYLWDENLPLPNIRELARNGTYAEANIPSNPSNTWSNHTTMVTGVFPKIHGVLHNGKLIRGNPGEPVFVDRDQSKYDLVHAQTIYDAAFQAGLKTAEINWPCTREAGTLHVRFPDTPYSVRFMSPDLRQAMMEKGLISQEDMQNPGLGRTGPGRAHLRTTAATHTIITHKPNILLIHITMLDTVHHNYGVDTDAGYIAASLADRYVGDILESLETAGIRERSTIFVVSDHGFNNVEYNIKANVLLRDHGLLQTDDDGMITNARIQVVSTGGTAMVFATNPETESKDIAKAKSIFENAEGIKRIITPDEYAELGYPHPGENEQMGNLVLVAGDQYAFNNSASGEHYIIDRKRGVHGFLNDNPLMNTIFIASGNGIKKGHRTGIVDNRYVAPIAAKILNINFDSSDAVEFSEILK